MVDDSLYYLTDLAFLNSLQIFNEQQDNGLNDEELETYFDGKDISKNNCKLSIKRLLTEFNSS